MSKLTAPGIRHLPGRAASGAAADVYRSTHWGFEPDAVFEVADPHLPRHKVTAMGYLDELEVKPYRADMFRLQFDPPTMLAFDPQRSRRLYIILTDKDRADLLNMFGNTEDWHHLADVAVEVGGRQANYPVSDCMVTVVGDLQAVIYTTHKKGDPPSAYRHRMGEHRGIAPALCMDEEGYLLVAGGSYDVKAAGIVR